MGSTTGEYISPSKDLESRRDEASEDCENEEDVDAIDTDLVRLDDSVLKDRVDNGDSATGLAPEGGRCAGRSP